MTRGSSLLSLGLTLLCGCTLCGNRELWRLRSPDGERELLVFERACGATTGFATHVSIVRPGKRLRDGDAANVYIEEDAAAPLSAHWEHARALVIKASGESFRKEASARGVSIRYGRDREVR